MNRLIPALGLMPTAVIGVSAAMNVAASAEDNAASTFVFGLGQTGHPKIDTPPKADEPLQGFAPRVIGEVVEFEAVANDVLKVSPVGPRRTFQGKRVIFNVEAVIVEEYKRRCKKIEERRPYSEVDHERGPTLNVGEQVQLVVEIIYSQDSHPVQYFATFEKPALISLKDSATVRIHLEFNKDQVAFAARPVNDEERSAYIIPEVERLKRERPTYRDVRSSGDRVKPGDLHFLKIAVELGRKL